MHYFHAAEDIHVRHENEVQNFTEMNLNQYNLELGKWMGIKMKKLVQRYQDQCPTGGRFFPEKYGLEEFRIKRYNAGDCFRQHVDVGDYKSARRFLAFLWYLNDDFEGGETLFRLPEKKIIQPKAGDVLIFPPTWQYPHEGLPVTTGTKYIMSTYLHYI